MARKRSVYRSVILALSVLLLSSCGEQSGPTTFKVTGKVTMDGSPVPEAVVVLHPKNKGEDSMLAFQAITDAEGLFEMRTHLEKDNYKEGMQPGAYMVTVTKLELPQDMRPGLHLGGSSTAGRYELGWLGFCLARLGRAVAGPS